VKASPIPLLGEENGIMKISLKHSGTGDFKTVDTGGLVVVYRQQVPWSSTLL